MTAELIDNVEHRRFEQSEGGALVFVTYRLAPGVISLTHFETEPAARGRGMAGRLMAAVVDHAREQGLKIQPLCSYAVDWFEKHPDAAAELRV